MGPWILCIWTPKFVRFFKWVSAPRGLSSVLFQVEVVWARTQNPDMGCPWPGEVGVFRQLCWPQCPHLYRGKQRDVLHRIIGRVSGTILLKGLAHSRNTVSINSFSSSLDLSGSHHHHPKFSKGTILWNTYHSSFWFRININTGKTFSLN